MKRIISTLLVIAAFFSNLSAKDGLSKQEVLSYVDSLGFPEWYYEINDVQESKKAFVEYLLPIIREQNEKIRSEREVAMKIFEKSYFEWSKIEHLKIAKLAKKYKIKSIYNVTMFEKRIAPIPESLVLAQAAIESGWGKSRFVRDANNIFGHWTFGKMGIVPSDRDAHKKHKLRLFKNISESVATYMLNLNRNHAYREFRAERYARLNSGDHLSGEEAAEKMRRYSEIGTKYVKIIKNVIKENNFHLLETKA